MNPVGGGRVPYPLGQLISKNSFKFGLTFQPPYEQAKGQLSKAIYARRTAWVVAKTG
jgi:hypothetical protein